MNASKLTKLHRSGFFNGNERGCLSASLGFPQDLFERCIARESTVSFEELKKMILSSTLTIVLHRSFNCYGLDYNRQVFNKAVDLVNSGKASFQLVRDARFSYEAFEELDLRGMKCDEAIVAQALKLCGLCLAPTRLTVELRLIQATNCFRRGRIQMWEYFELLPMCELFSDCEQSCPKSLGERGTGGLYPIEDFASILMTGNERTGQFLEDKYQKIRRKQRTEKVSADGDVSGLLGSVRQVPRRQRAISSATAAVAMWERIEEAEKMLRQSRAGVWTQAMSDKLRATCDQDNDMGRSSVAATPRWQGQPAFASGRRKAKQHQPQRTTDKPHSVLPLADPQRAEWGRHNVVQDDSTADQRMPSLGSHAPGGPKESLLPPIVTKKDVEDHKRRMADVACDMVMLDRARKDVRGEFCKAFLDTDLKTGRLNTSGDR